MGINTVPQPPHSPDLAPCDFWLFPKLKEKLRGCRYEINEEMKEAVTKVIDTLTQEDFHGAFQKLLELYIKCFATGGDYFGRGQEFHECNINKSAHTKKSGNLFNDPRIYIYIYIYECVYVCGFSVFCLFVCCFIFFRNLRINEVSIF